LLNLYSVNTRVVVHEPGTGLPLLDTKYKHFIVSSSFDAAVTVSKELAEKQCKEVMAASNDVEPKGFTSIDPIVVFVRRFPKDTYLSVSTIECTQEATGIQIDPSVLTAQVAEKVAG
jgi:hypothetical protein